jgi:hypothetical protein
MKKLLNSRYAWISFHPTNLRSLLAIFFLTATSLVSLAAEEPQIKIAEFASTEGIKLSVQNLEKLSVDLTIISTSVKPVNDLRVMASRWIGPNGQVVEVACTVDAKPCSGTSLRVPGMATAIKLHLEAQIPIAGNYAGSLALIYDNNRNSVPVAVARTDTATTVRFTSGETARNAPYLSVFRFPTLRLTLEETSGQGVTLAVPQLVSFVRKDADKKSQAPFKRIQFFLGDQCKTPIQDKFGLAAHQSQPVRAKITGFAAAGEYVAKIRVAADNAQPVDEEVTLLVRDNLLIAVFFILLGVRASWMLRSYLRVNRPRMLLQRRALRLAQEVQNTRTSRSAAFTPEEKQLLDQFSGRLADLYGQREPENGPAILDELDAKLDLFTQWVNVRLALDSVDPQSIVSSLRSDWDSTATLLEAKGSSQTEIQQARTKLEEVSQNIKKATRDYWLDEIQKFQAQIAKQKEISLQETNARFDNEVIPLLARAKECADGLRLPEAGQKFHEARLLYIRILAEEVGGLIPSQPPAVIPTDEWMEWRNAVLNQLTTVLHTDDLEKAAAAYDKAYTTYLTKLIAVARKMADETDSDVGKVRNQHVDDAKNWDQALTETKGALNSAENHLKTGSIQLAATDYGKAQKQLTGVRKAIDSLARSGKLGPHAATVQLQSLLTAAAPGKILTAEGPKRVDFLSGRSLAVSYAEIDKKLARYDKFLNWSVSGIAVLLGLQVLWVANPTWGGMESYLAALGWGLGLHQVAGTAAGAIFDWDKTMEILEKPGTSNA